MFALATCQDSFSSTVVTALKHLYSSAVAPQTAIVVNPSGSRNVSVTQTCQSQVQRAPASVPPSVPPSANMLSLKVINPRKKEDYKCIRYAG